jgi:glycosyltransferase involved in cell wall biosynthesis
MGKVSVIIPCYNHGRYLFEAITSVFNQTYKNIEVIVVNDGSNDNTEYVSTQFELVKYYKTENRGVSHARNYGIKKSSGEYIICLDADDTLKQNYIEEVIKYIDQYDIIGTNFEFFGDRNEIVKRPFTHINFNKLKHSNYVHCAAIFKREMFNKIGGFDENMIKGYEDWEYWRRAARLGYSIYIHNDALLNYRKHNKSRNKDADRYYSELRNYIKSKEKGLIDIVYPLGNGSPNSDNELRYSIRSLEKFGRNYKDIYIIGKFPHWGNQRIKHFGFKETKTKALNILDKIYFSCNVPEISDTFLYINDDHILLKETDLSKYPYYYNDNDAKSIIESRPISDNYRKIIEETINNKHYKHYFDIHTPILIHKKQFIEMYNIINFEASSEGLLVKSMYCGYNNINGVEKSDIILRQKHECFDLKQKLKDEHIFSFHDEAVCQDLVDFLHNVLPDKSEYEL